MSEAIAASQQLHGLAPSPQNDGLSASVWHRSAGPALQLPRLSGSQSVEIAIIGAGFTGLSAAIALLEQGSSDVAVIDAGEPGQGASGRNGGQVIPVLKRTPESLISALGEDVARGVIDLVVHSADTLFGLIDHYGIDCEPMRSGWIQAARSAKGEPALRERCRIWSEQKATCRWLGADEVARLSGSRAFTEGWMLTSGGSVHPLKYARGLASVALGLGGRVFGDSLVTGLARNGDGWLLSTADGATLNARQVLLATNGYTTDLWPGLRQSVIPVYSMQVATDPLPASVAAEILHEGQTMTDANHLVHYFRRDAERRFIMGSRGPFRDRLDQASIDALIARTRNIYPQLAGVDFPHRWTGKVAMTTDSLPHMHRLAPGLIAGLGFNGRGVALATTIGRVIAAACKDDAERTCRWPITPLRPISMHRMHHLGVRMMVSYYRVADRIGH